MKPRSGDPEKPGLLEYLEDIIGSNQFKDDIEKKDEEYEILQVRSQPTKHLAIFSLLLSIISWMQLIELTLEYYLGKYLEWT